MNARKAHKIWLRLLRGREYRKTTRVAAFEKAKSWYLRSSRRARVFDDYIKEGHWTENDQNTYVRLRRRRAKHNKEHRPATRGSIK